MMLGAVVETLFPLRCLGCGRGPGPFCACCVGALVPLAPLAGPGCRRCGRPSERDAERCRDCPPDPIAWSRSAFVYEGPARSALMRVKFSGWRSAARALAPLVADAARAAPLRSDAQVLTWVPLGRRRRRTRGFDQAEAMARELGRVQAWPVQRLLRRVTETAPQARRGGRDRREALRDAFISVSVPPRSVVLVDDVLTTGATAAACATTLVNAGAARVGVLTFARALGRRDAAEEVGRRVWPGRSM
jgi:ComF family protein